MTLSPSATTLRRISVDCGDYIRRFRDEPRFAGACRACGNYGRRWGCPPFSDNSQPPLDSYSNTELFLLKIDLQWDGVDGSQSEMAALMGRLANRLRHDYEPMILDMERETGGRAALFTGMCPHCPDRECARAEGRACRHPRLVRPSLEALGFDLVRTAREVFGVDIRWAAQGEKPPYMCLIAGLFH